MAKGDLKEIRIRAGPDPQWAKLLMLREMTRTTGILTELQVLQLKCWPLVFTDATESECEFGFETKTIVFKLKKLKGKKPKNFKERLDHLSKAAQRLLGDEYTVLTFLDGKKVHNVGSTSDA